MNEYELLINKSAYAGAKKIEDLPDEDVDSLINVLLQDEETHELLARLLDTSTIAENISAVLSYKKTEHYNTAGMALVEDLIKETNYLLKSKIDEDLSTAYETFLLDNEEMTDNQNMEYESNCWHKANMPEKRVL